MLAYITEKSGMTGSRHSSNVSGTCLFVTLSLFIFVGGGALYSLAGSL